MKFKVGDFIKGKKNNGYSVTNEKMKKAKVVDINEYMMKMKILEHSNKEEIGKNYTVTNDRLNEKFELIKQFTKSDLKDGDIVTYRNGKKRIVQGESLKTLDGNNGYTLQEYRKDLIDKRNITHLDIIKVERPVKYETVFERKEEILDKAEKRWLSNFIKSTEIEVKYIRKWLGASGENEYLEISYMNYYSKNNILFLPIFKRNTKYKGMKLGKEYTLEELGL